MAGCRVGAKNCEEIGESVHSHTHVHLCSATLFEDLIEFLPFSANHCERVKPLRSFKPICEDDNVGRDCDLMIWCLYGFVVWIGIGTLGAKGHALLTDAR